MYLEYDYFEPHPLDFTLVLRKCRKRKLLMMFIITLLAILHLCYVLATPPYDGPTRANFTNLLSKNLGSNESTCSEKATLRGLSQKVISFSFYGQKSNTRDYFNGIEINAQLMMQLYPNWTMRVYHDITDGSMNETLDDFENRFGQILDMCFAGNLPGYGNLLYANQMSWRFLTLSDPLVDITLIRDLDSNLNLREVEAVQEWIKSPHPLHVMRDNPYHTIPILGGMWGANLVGKRQIWRKVIDDLLFAGKTVGKKGSDQNALEKFLWPWTEKEDGFVMQHDSYYCNKSRYLSVGGLRPFPSCRDKLHELNFVGSRRKVDTGPMLKKCPEPCRPKPHCDLC